MLVVDSLAAIVRAGQLTHSSVGHCHILIQTVQTVKYKIMIFYFV